MIDLKLKLILLLLSIAALASVAHVSAAANASGQDREGGGESTKLAALKQLSGSIFMKAKKTLSLLREVAGTQYDHFHAQELIQMHYPQKNKCDKEYFYDMNNRAEHLDQFRRSIGPYITYCKKKQLEFCRKTFSKRLAETVAEFDNEELADVQLLMDKIDPPNKLLKTFGIVLDVPREKIKEAAVHFLITKKAEVEAKNSEAANYDELYEEIESQLLERCKKVDLLLSSFVFIHRSMTKAFIDYYAWIWLQLAKICHPLRYDSSLIFDIESAWTHTVNSDSNGHRQPKRREQILV